ncbi:MAG: VOC family protein [Acidimicrobiales bacterium]|nr:VOC family protein [Acidimicrobiales bacterium]
MEPRLSLVTLGVGDLARSIAFYEALGFTDASTDESVAFLQAGGMVLGLWDRASLAEDSGVDDDHGGWGGVTLAHNTRTPEEVDAVLAEAEAAGATILRPAEQAFWGGYSGLFADPDGHRWEVAHNPYWKIGDDGAIELG